jgi:hypothetical protein
MKTQSGSPIIAGVIALLLLSVLWFIPAPVQAATVTQLDITGGSISLNFGVLGSVTGNFTQNGQLVMGQYQPLPNVFPPVTIAGHTFSVFTSGMNGNPVPSGSTTGSTISANLTSLFAGVTGPLMNTASLNIGGNAAGTFNETTNTYNLSWTKSFTGLGVPFLTSGTFSLQGTAQLAAVPLPAAALLFGSGLMGLFGFRKRRQSL